MLVGLNLNESTNVGIGSAPAPTKLLNENFDFTAMGVEMMAECDKSWGRINRMTSEANCAIIHESITNPEGVGTLLEGAVANFFNKIKEFFKKIWGMVRELFEKFMMWINSKIKSDKEFIKKYKKEIISKMGIIKELDVSGFKYTINNTNTSSKVSAIDQYIDTMATETPVKPDEADDMIEKAKKGMAKTIIGKEEDDDSEMASALFELFRNGESQPEDITIRLGDVNEMIAELESYSDAKKTVEKDQAAFEKTIGKGIKAAEKASAALSKKENFDPDIKTGYDTKLTIIKSGLRMANLYASYKLAALKERAAFDKKVMLKIKSATKKSESTLAEGTTSTNGLFTGSI